MRPVPPAAAVVVLLALAGCGSSGGDQAAARPLPPVRLAVTAPRDGAVTLQADVKVSGTVSPAGAAVVVMGAPAAVSGGSFSVRVPLEEGANVIDVTASAAGDAPALTAVRVVREVRVTIPDLIGQPAAGAEARLRALGLAPVEEHGGGIFDALLPGERSVCDTAPRGGVEVRKGTRVTVTAAKRC
ncbi:MAG: hypothetical protein QOE28_1300 [Solirubrobacteraceae bacterium]|nr:hypothetical protein [Solirubrobacteraceae bacterium]